MELDLNDYRLVALLRNALEVYSDIHSNDEDDEYLEEVQEELTDRYLNLRLGRKESE